MKRADLIRAGVAMFKESCFECSTAKDGNGQRHWSGKTCDGGGSYITHRMNQDTMTPVAVAHQVGHVMAIRKIREIRAAAEEKANIAAALFYDIELES